MRLKKNNSDMDDLRETTSMARLWINKDAWKEQWSVHYLISILTLTKLLSLQLLGRQCQEVVIAGNLWKSNLTRLNQAKSTTSKVEMVGNLTEEPYDSPAICKVIRTLK